MSDEKFKPENDKPLRREDKPFRAVVETGHTLKKSRFCRHGNVWGKCPYGC